MLTPEYIDGLGEAGVDLINMSVDSVVEFEHSGKDLVRRRKVLDDLLEARRRHGFEITVNLVLNNRNIDVALQTLELMHSYRIPISVGFIVKHLFHDEQEPSLFFRTEAEKQRLFEVLDAIVEMRRRGMNIIEPTRYFLDLKRFVNHELDWECMAGRDSIGIDTLGELKFCGTLPTENVSIFDLERLDTRALYRWRRDRYGECQERCVTNCRYVTYYYYRHPLRFVVEMAWFRRAVHALRERLSRLLGRPSRPASEPLRA
jgi:MoaA/NifB/PqqE/SkfB family radical SAM enzyme